VSEAPAFSTSEELAQFAVLAGPEDGDVVVVASGEIDLYSATMFRDVLFEALAQARRSLVVDLGGVSFIDCSCVNVVAAAHASLAEGLSLSVRGTRPITRRVFEITGLTSVLEPASRDL
jgi:anti-anti-sigma factor